MMLYVVPRAFVIHFVVLWLARHSLFVLKVGTRQNVEQCASPLVSLDHVIDLHFDTFSCSLYTTISNPNANPNTNPNPNHIPNPNRKITLRNYWSADRPDRSANCHRSDPPHRSTPLRILSCPKRRQKTGIRTKEHVSETPILYQVLVRFNTVLWSMVGICLSTVNITIPFSVDKNCNIICE